MKVIRGTLNFPINSRLNLTTRFRLTDETLEKMPWPETFAKSSKTMFRSKLRFQASPSTVTSHGRMAFETCAYKLAADSARRLQAKDQPGRRGHQRDPEMVQGSRRRVLGLPVGRHQVDEQQRSLEVDKSVAKKLLLFTFWVKGIRRGDKEILLLLINSQ